MCRWGVEGPARRPCPALHFPAMPVAGLRTPCAAQRGFLFAAIPTVSMTLAAFSSQAMSAGFELMRSIRERGCALFCASRTSIASLSASFFASMAINSSCFQFVELAGNT